MEYLVKGGNASGLLRIELKANEFVCARKNALCAFSPLISFTQSKPAGFFRRLAQKFAGAHQPMQQITAAEENGWIMLAPPMIGAINGIELHGKNIFVQCDAFLAAEQSTQTNGKIYPMTKTKFVHESFEAIKFGGEGLVFLNAFGAIKAVTILPEQAIRIDPDYLIAWEDTLTFDETDRGFIAVNGPGRLWLQTRTPHAFDEWQNDLKESYKSANS